MQHINLRILETQQDLAAVELLQTSIWPGSEIEIVPVHLLLASIHNGGLVIGAYESPANTPESEHPREAGSFLNDQPPVDLQIVGFVFGFPGIYDTPDGPHVKHHSHMLGVLPSHRDRGIGFLLKRAQWQMVRHQGLDRVTWTYDPLLSRNAHLNITRLGAVCSTYFPNFYGEMRDGLNAGIPTDRFQVDWWVNSKRVVRRLSKRPRLKLDLAHFLAAGTKIVNPSQMGSDGHPHPANRPASIILKDLQLDENSLLLVEIPADYQSLKSADPELALEWRLHTQSLFIGLFDLGFLVTDFVHLKGTYSRSFYVLSHGDSTL